MDSHETAVVLASVTAALQTEPVGKAYDDLRPVAQELGEIGRSVLRIAHAPLRVVASYAERWVRVVENATARVSESNKIDPAPSICGPILENVKYLEEGNPLLELYTQLLASAMDRDKVEKAHPAFAELLKHLSADEATLLYRISRQSLRQVDQHRLYPGQKPEVTSRCISMQVPSALVFKGNVRMYLQHLEMLSLVTRISPDSRSSGPWNDSQGAAYYDVEMEVTWVLSEFGEFFAAACMPARWEFLETETTITDSGQ